MNDARATPPAAPGLVAARTSILAALVCFATNCVANRILFPAPGKQPDAPPPPLPSPLWGQAIGVATTCVLLAGVAAGVRGAWVGWRTGNRDVTIIASIGLVLNLGTILVMLFILSILRAR